MKRPSTGLLTNDRSRQFPLRGLVTKPIATCCVARLVVLASEAPEQPIMIRIHSPGGLIAESLMIVSTMKGLKCPIRTLCHNEVGGAAILIAAQGSPGLRTATASTRFCFEGLLNEPSLIPGQKELVGEVLAQSTQKPLQVVLEWMAEGVTFDAKDAIANGLIDSIAANPL
jgi:ATP-dependent Clp protease, protease subunit